MKQFFEDTNPKDDLNSSPTIVGLDQSAGDGQDEITVAVLPDGTFAVKKNGVAIPVSDSVQKELQKEFDRQKRYKEAVKQGQKPDEIKAKDDNRFLKPKHHKIDDDNRFKDDPSRLPYYKQGMDKETQALFDRGYFESGSVGQLTEVLKYMIFQLANNQIVEADDDDDRIRVDKSYLRPNRRAVLDDDSTARGRRRVHYEPDEDEEEDELETVRPLALVYRDCSGSFGTVAKTKLAEDILAVLKSDYFVDDEGRKLLEVDDFYFATKVSKTISGAGGGTHLDEVIEHARPRIEGRVANVIIITDKDAESYSQYKPLVVNGSVWLIYCDTYAPNFGKAFRLEGNDSVFEEFFFNNI